MLFIFLVAVLCSIDRWKDSEIIRSDVGLLVGFLTFVLAVGFLLIPLGEGFRGERFSGIYFNPNTAGLTASLLVPAALAMWQWTQKPFYLTAALVGILTILTSQSRTPLLAVSAALVVWYILSSDKFRLKASTLLAACMASVVFVAVLISTRGLREFFSGAFSRLIGQDQSADTFSGREAIWRNALDATAQRPVFGHGYSNSPPLDPGDYGTQFASELDVRGIAANSYVQALVETGLVGFTLVIAAVSVLLYISVKMMRTSKMGGFGAFILVGLLVQLTESPLLAAGQAYPWVFWIVALSRDSWSLWRGIRYQQNSCYDAIANPEKKKYHVCQGRPY